jgi:hypothetical protein
MHFEIIKKNQKDKLAFVFYYKFWMKFSLSTTHMAFMSVVSFSIMKLQILIFLNC